MGDYEKERRIRWKLAKRRQRARRKVPPKPVSPALREWVLEERDRRERAALHARREINGVWVDVAWRSSDFVADVWMAKVLLGQELGAGKVTPTRIARWLWNEKRHGNYAQNSLRPMVYRAFKIIEELETNGPREGDPPFWGPFELPDL